MTRIRILIGLVAFALPMTQMEPAQAQKGPLVPKKNINNPPNIKNVGNPNNLPNIKNVGNPNNAAPNLKNIGGGGINNLKNNPNALQNLKGGNLNNALPNLKNTNAFNNLKNSGVLNNLKNTNALNAVQKGNFKGIANNIGVKNNVPISNRTGANAIGTGTNNTTNTTNTKNINTGPINISNRFPKGAFPKGGFPNAGPIVGPNVVNNFNNNRRWPGFGAGLGIGLAIPLASRMIAPPVAYSVVEYPVAAPVFFGAPAFLVPEQPFEPELIGTNPQPQDASGSQMTEAGLKILEVIEGGIAKKVDLRPGDVIVGIGEFRVQTFDELQLALANAKGEVDVIFLNGETGKVERLPVTPDKGKIGVSVEPVDLN